MYPPFFMTKEAMGAVAQLSDFDDQLYKVCYEGKLGPGRGSVCTGH